MRPLGAFLSILFAQIGLPGSLRAEVPHIINYQGRMVVNGTNFDGAGQFKFALVNANGSQTYWTNSNDTAPADGIPDAAVALPVSKGLYSVLLGDPSIPNMAAVGPAVFSNADVRLRVWFNDGSTNWQQLSPDQRIAAVGYALMADSVPDGSITTAKIAPGAITAAQIAAGAVTASSIGAETPDGAQARVDALGASIAGGGMTSLKTVLGEGKRTASIHIISDSTNSNSYWSLPLATAIGQLYPNYAVKRIDWAPAGADWTAPSVIQAGSGGDRRWEFAAGTQWSPIGYSSDFPMPAGDLDLRAKVRIDNNSATLNTLFSKWDNGGKIGFRIIQTTPATSRKLLISYSVDGASWQDVLSTAGLAANGINDGSVYWARITVDIDNGSGGKTFAFYTSTDGANWVALGTPVTAAAGGTAPLSGNGANCYLGGAGGPAQLVGAVYAAEIRDGIGGAPIHPLNLDAWSFNEGAVALKGAPELWVSNAAFGGASVDTFLALPPAYYCRNYSPQIILISLSHNNLREQGNRFITKMQSLVTKVRAVYGEIPRIIFLTQNPQLRIPSPSDPNCLYEDARTAHRSQFMTWASGAGYGVIDTWAAFEKDPRQLELLVGTNTWLQTPITSLGGNGTLVTVNVADMSYFYQLHTSRVAIIGATQPNGQPSSFNGSYWIQAMSANETGPGWITFTSNLTETAVLTGATASACDGVHPSTAGYQLWADTVFAAFKRGVP